MESLLKTATSGKIERPPFVIVYGQDGVGKSSMLADAPDVIFGGPETGTDHLDVTRVSGLDTFEKNINFLNEILAGGHKFKNLAFESIDHLEKIIFSKVCKEDGSSNINKALGGYGAGFARADALTVEMINLLKQINQKMGVYVTAHFKVKTFSDPNTDTDYQRYSIKTREETAGYWKEAVDAVLFAHYEVSKGKDAARAFGDGTRLLGTEWRPAFEAKNRFGLDPEIPLSYPAFIEAVKMSEPDKIKEYANEIESLREKLKDDKERLKKLDARTKQAVESKDVGSLKKITEQLKALEAA